jgi:hypothetical protein
VKRVSLITEWGRCGPDDLGGGAAPAQLFAVVAGLPASFVGVPELECFVDELAVLAHWSDHGMIAQER